MNENRVKNGTGKRRKTLSAALAIAMALVMLMSGTLAYFYQSRAVNTITGTEKNVIGHDDFVKLPVGDDGATRYEKNVYVENLGAEPVFVRVKLTEEFTLQGEPVTVNAGGQVTPVTHIPASGDQAVDENADLVGIGTDADGHDTAAEGDIHSYFTWDMGTRGEYDQTKKFYKSAKAAEYNDDKNPDGTAKTDPTPDIRIEEGVAKDSSNTAYEGNEKDVKGLSYASVITMQEYLAMSQGYREAFAGWVIDSTKDGNSFTKSDGTTASETVDGDGWAYWSQMLPAYATTGLLLNGVTVSPALADKQYTYNINVDFEVVDETDEGLWIGTKTQATNKTNFTEAQLNAMRVQTEGAKELLANAKAVASEKYTPEVNALIVDITTEKEKATSDVAKALYDQAINSAKSSADSIFVKQDVEDYLKMAREVERMKMSGTEEEKAYLQSTILELSQTTNESGKVEYTLVPAQAGADEPNRITDMDPEIAAYLVKRYGGGDNILTGEEALGVTTFSSHNTDQYWTSGYTHVFNNWNSFTKENFPNLIDVTIYGKICSTDESPFSMKNFAIIEKDSAGNEVKVDGKAKVDSSIKRFNIQDFLTSDEIKTDTNSGDIETKAVELDVSYLKNIDSLRLANAENKNWLASGYTELRGLKYIYLWMPYAISDAELITLLKHSPNLEECTILSADTLYDSTSTTEPKELLTDWNKPGEGKSVQVAFTACKNLKSITLRGSGEIDLSQCTKLTYVRSLGSLTIYVADVDALTYKETQKDSSIKNISEKPKPPSSGGDSGGETPAA